MATVRLTDVFVKQLKCSGDTVSTEVRDSEVQGLEIRVAKGGTKSWRLHYTRRSDGKRRAVGLGRYPAVSLKEARSKARINQAKIEDLDTGADPAATRQGIRHAETFSELAEEWLTRHARPNKVERAVADDLSMLKRHVLPYLAHKKVGQIKKRDILELIDAVANAADARRKKILDRRMSHRPNRVFELVRSIFRWAMSRDIIEVDPTVGLSQPVKKEAPRERDLSTAEIRILWKALDQAPVKRPKRATDGIPMVQSTALAVKLALVTGQRIGEVTGTNKKELYLIGDQPIWIVPAERAKNRLANRVPLSELAVSIIQEAMALAQDSEWLFPSPKVNRPVSSHAPTRAIARVRFFIGLDDFRIHDLRRTAATGMAELGVFPHTISLILNHASARSSSITNRVYVQYSYDKEKREALVAWGDKLMTLTG